RRCAVPGARRGSPLHHGSGTTPRLGERPLLLAGFTAGRTREDAPRRPADLRVRARSEEDVGDGHPTARYHGPRRHQANAPTRDGAVPGGDLHLPRDRDPPRGRTAHRRTGEQVAPRVPPGAMEGCPADPVRRSVAAGPPGRLDLPGTARRRARPHTRRAALGAGGEMSYDTVVVGA